ncbi:MAG: hypothetical protein RLZ97_2434, partial [Verrucomicrobiota bacterium]
MKEFRAPDIRNVAVVGPPAAGKTLLCEAMLRCCGGIERIGSIAQGNTASDFHADEKLHQISIHATVLATEWIGREINLIDCPGSPDFISEPLSAVRVADSAMVVISATSAVDTGADEVWEAAADYGIPRMLVVSQLDRESTRFDEIVNEAREHYGPKVIPLSLPVDVGPGFCEVLDVMRSEVIRFATDGSGSFEERPAEGVLREKVVELHRALIDLVAESDDELLEEFLDQGTLSEEHLREHVHEAFQKGLVIPVFATSGLGNVGVTRLLDFVAKYGSTPADRAKVTAITPDASETEVSLADS